MTLECLRLDVITQAAIAVRPIAYTVNAMATVQSNLSANQPSTSPIELANSAQTRVFIASVVFGVIAALVAASLAVMVWKTNNGYQDAIKADADARIEVARTEAVKAQTEAVRIDVEGKERIAKVEADADLKIADARAIAAKANERAGVLELRAQELTQENLILRSDVANLEKEATEAGRKLERLRKRQRPRGISANFLQVLKCKPPGAAVVLYIGGSSEVIMFTENLCGKLRQAGWEVTSPMRISSITDLSQTGMVLGEITVITSFEYPFPENEENLIIALLKEGFNVGIRTETTLPDSRLRIVIESKF